MDKPFTLWSITREWHVRARRPERWRERQTFHPRAGRQDTANEAIVVTSADAAPIRDKAVRFCHWRPLAGAWNGSLLRFPTSAHGPRPQACHRRAFLLFEAPSRFAAASAAIT
jgi:hypothetical protein